MEQGDKGTKGSEGKEFLFKGESVTIRCGANSETLDEMAGFTVGDIRGKMREILNIGEDHMIVTIDDGSGQKEVDEKHVLLGGEVVEFKKPAGQKG